MIFDMKDIGNIVKDDKGVFWRVISFSINPHVTIECIDERPCRECGKNKRIGFSSQCPIADDFVRLVEEKEK